MPNSMELQDAIRTLAEELHLPEIAPDDDGIYTVVFDGELAVEIVPWDDSTVLLRTPLEALPVGDPDKEKLMLQRVMQFSLARLRGRRTTTSLDAPSNRLLLTRTLALSSLRPFEFSAAIEDFVNDLDMWQRFLDSGVATSSTASSSYSGASSGYQQPMMIIMP